MRPRKRCCALRNLPADPPAAVAEYHRGPMPSPVPLLRRLLVGAAVWLPVAPAQQAAAEGKAPHVLVVGDLPRGGGPSLQLLADRLQQHCCELEERLGATLPGDTPPCRIQLCSQRDDAEAAMRSQIGRELVGVGGIDRQSGRIVVWAGGGDHAPRVATVAAVAWWSERLLAPIDVDAAGAAWLLHGLAHLQLARSGGTCDSFVVRDALFSLTRCHGGEFVAAAATLAREGRLPALSALLQTAGDDVDFDRHAAAALVDWLSQAGGFGQTGPDAGRGASALQHVAAQLRVGKTASEALSAVFHEPLADVERRWHEALLDGGKAGAKRPPGDPPAPRPTHPSASMYVYVREPVRPRHRRVVDAALAARAASLTSAFRTVDNAPQIALGPVERGANFWKRGRLGKPIDHAWPFVVVLEYELAGGPQAFVDCFRRATGSRHDGGWMLDPNVDFVAHHDKQLATDQDDRFGYVAIPDTPTGTHVGGSEFVHRGRVQWADGRVARLGVWTLLEPQHQRPEAQWAAQHRWLVDWRVTARSAAAGATGCGPLDRPDRELAIWGTSRVLDLPEVPVGVRAGAGR